jgi:tetratricopeptide (TPR) repeat protein
MRSATVVPVAKSCATSIWLRRALSLDIFIVCLLVHAGAQVQSSKTAETKTTEIRSRLRTAEEELKSNNAEASEKDFRAVLALDSRNAEAHVYLGLIAMSRGDCRAASQDFREALAVQPSLIKAKALLGICGRRLGDSSAKALLQSSFLKLTDVKLRTQVGMELIGLYHQQGDSEHAISVVQKLVDINPDNADILYSAQRLYRELADDTMNKLAMLAPGSARMQQVIAENLINQNDLKDAIEHYRKALQINPLLPGVHFELGEAILESARADTDAEAQAQKEFETAVAVDGDSAKTECEFGSIALLQSKQDQAFAHYQRAYQLDPNEIQAQMGLAKMLLQEKPQEAVKYLRMAVQSDPLNGSAHYQLAQAYRRLQMTDAAQKEMHLFQEIKTAKDQVEALYHQMNRPRSQTDDMPDAQELNQGQPLKDHP